MPRQVGLIGRGEGEEVVLGVLARQDAQAVDALVEIEQRPGVAQLVGRQHVVVAVVELDRRHLAGLLELDQLGLRGIAAGLGDRADLGGDLARLLGGQHRDLAGLLGGLIGHHLGDGVVARRTAATLYRLAAIRAHRGHVAQSGAIRPASQREINVFQIAPCQEWRSGPRHRLD